METAIKETIKKLSERAGKDHDSGNSMRLSQSALNLAHTLANLDNVSNKPVAWLHTLDNTDGIPENEPMKRLTFSNENPFGKPDVDYSKEYEWTAIPLYR